MAHKERGDTLVEVLMSLMVLSIVVVGAVTLMARGLQSVQIALEHSETRQAVNSQIELLKYLRDQHAINSSGTDGLTWASIAATSNNNPTDYTGCNVTASKSGTAFYLDRSSGTVQKLAFDSSLKPTTFAIPGRGLWIEADPSDAGISPAYTDFVIRACWFGSGSLGGQQQTVTALRLYDPSR